MPKNLLSALNGRKFDFLGAGFMAGRNGMEGVQEGVQGEEGAENGAERSGLLDFQQWIKQGCQKSRHLSSGRRNRRNLTG